MHQTRSNRVILPKEISNTLSTNTSQRNEHDAILPFVSNCHFTGYYDKHYCHRHLRLQEKYILVERRAKWGDSSSIGLLKTQGNATLLGEHALGQLASDQNCGNSEKI